MTPLSVEFVLVGGGAALVMIGAVAALLSANAIKRVGGLLVSGFGAVAALAAMGAGSAPVIVGVAVLFAYAVVGTAVVVRLQESYGSIEAPEIDAADGESDAQERAS
ncbi:MAG: hypothetical protein ABL871_01875 [Terricaulis sp.]